MININCAEMNTQVNLGFSNVFQLFTIEEILWNGIMMNTRISVQFYIYAQPIHEYRI